jgi:hypothetical protein
MLEAPNYDIVRTIGSGAFGTAMFTQVMYFRRSIGRQVRL